MIDAELEHIFFFLKAVQMTLWNESLLILMLLCVCLCPCVFDFQEPAPMTEDLLEEQSEVLAKLGTSAEGTHLRARMQSACLLSDMESFKVIQADLQTFSLYMSFLYQTAAGIIRDNH